MTPYYDSRGITIYHGDCREVLPEIGAQADLAILDPPYAETSLSWDDAIEGLMGYVGDRVKWTGTVWCFGSMRSHLAMVDQFLGWRQAQDVIWEKHNGSGMAADRFRRVHEIAVHWYRGRWDAVYKSPVYTMDATKRTVRRKQKPTHWNQVGETGPYESHDGGPRMMRSVIKCRSCHGSAVHPTQKPVELLRHLIEYSCPFGGLVLDPTCGSGSTLVASREMGMKSIGIDDDEACCEIAAKRLAQKVLF